MKIGSLFSGYEGLGMAVQSVLGGDIAWVSDIDPGACKILAHRYPDVPNIGDITAVDWSAVEPVDVMTMGFPCTDVSCAGLRLGLTPTTRSGLWSYAARAINALRPPLVVIENVRGLLSATAEHPSHSDVEPCPWELGEGSGPALRALGAVLGDLADIGYDAEWIGLRAADVGAPHGRFRVFVTAWPAVQDPDVSARRERRFAAPGQAQERWARPDAGGRGGASTADAYRSVVRLESVAESGSGGAPLTGHSGPEAAADAPGIRWTGRDESWQDVEQDGPQSAHAGALGRAAVDWGQYGPAIERWERRLGRSSPAPTELSPKGGARLSPAFVEWMQGLPEGWVTDPAIWDGMTDKKGRILTGHRLASARRDAQLKALGNGVVPQQAAQALRMLLPDVVERAA